MEVETEDGRVGLGEGLTIPPVCARIVSQVLRPMLVGQDAEPVEALWDRMYFGIGYSGMRGLALEAISAVDIALWDLRGQREGKPICDLLELPVLRREVNCYAAGLYYNPLEDIVEEAKEYVGRGFRALKMKVGQGLELDVERVRAVRRAAGADTQVLIDANCRYTAAEAIELARRVADENVGWFEEPVIVEDLAGYRAVREAGFCRVSGGEGEATRWGFGPLLEQGCVDVVQPDIMRAGGFTECVRIARMAEEYGVAYSPHNWGSIVGYCASLHISAVAPTFEIFELEQIGFPLREELGANPPPLNGDVWSVPTEPGLGIRLDPVARAKYLVAVE